jgi:voltage-gated sodium channel
MIRNNIQKLVTSRRFEQAVIILVILNAITLGLETMPISTRLLDTLYVLDRVFVAVFSLEIVLKLIAFRFSFFRSGWNVFDLIIVVIALIPAVGPFSVLRALRILRVLRLISTIPAMRRVIDGFVHALSGLVSVAGIMLLIFYVSAVMATKLFGESFPEFFGSIPNSLYSLFQIMTLESWSMGIVRPVLEVFPYAWLFFIPFILVTTFAVLNLIIGIIVNSMQVATKEERNEIKEVVKAQHASQVSIESQLAVIENNIRELRTRLEREKSAQGE